MHQAVWQRVWQRLPESFVGGNLRAWVFRVARNYVVDCARKRTPQSLPQADDADAFADAAQVSPHRRLEEQERQDILRRCLKKLEATAARVVRSRLAGEQYVTICEQTGLQPAQAHKVFYQAKQQLRDCVQRAAE